MLVIPRKVPPEWDMHPSEYQVAKLDLLRILPANLFLGLLKKPFEHSERRVFPRGGKRLTGEQITAGMIGDRQRVAVVMIPEQELALVIGAPECIGSLPQR